VGGYLGDLVFENKNAKIKSFLKLFIGLPIFVLTVVSMKLINKLCNDFGKTITFILIALAVSLIFGAFLGLYSAHKISKMKITLSDNGIDVVKGATQGFYLLEDFVECQINTVSGARTVKVIQSLVFSGEEGLLFIDCYGFSYEEFLQIADAIRVRRHLRFDKEKDENSELLSDDHYFGSYEDDNERTLLNAVYFFAVLLLPMCGLIAYLMYSKGLTPLNVLLIILISAFLIAIVSAFFFIRDISKKTQKSIAKNLSFDSFDIKVNDDVWSYSKIQSIYITQPYLTAIGKDDARVLQIKCFDSSEPTDYIVEKRPKSYTSSDAYTKLYNSIIGLSESKGIRVEPLRMPKNEKR
jgi:hypothetical protein